MNIAIYTFDYNWAGGVDLLDLIVKGILAQEKKDIRIFILIHNPKKIHIDKRFVYQKIKNTCLLFVEFTKGFKDFKNQKFNRLPVHQQNAPFIQFDYLHEVFKSENVDLAYYNQNSVGSFGKVCKKLKIDVVVPLLNSDNLHNSKIPTVGYIFDFVYKYLTHLYSPKFCLETDVNFSKTLLKNNAIIVNSIQTKLDILKFYPYADNVIFTMPFSPFVSSYILREAKKKESVLESFNIARRYFIVCNQFWKHKSHETVFSALRILKDEYNITDLDIVCTGSMIDLSGGNSRRDYLQNFINELGVSNNVHFLGHIDKINQISLMLKSIALIQPTQFEGGPGGGSVYQAVASGVRCVLSDIPVNLEIKDEPFVTFFKLCDSKDLAMKLFSIISDKSFYDNNSLEDLEARNHIRLLHLGDVLINAMESSINSLKD